MDLVKKHLYRGAVGDITEPAFFLLVCGIVGIVLAGQIMIGLSNGFIPCYQDCGETFVALQQVHQFDRHGFDFGLMQNHATGDDLTAHPYLYTHNVSIPTIVFPLIHGLGVTSIAGLQMITLVAFVLGLVYGALLVKLLTGSRLVAVAFLALMASDVAGVQAFGLNALRAWHWLALFIMLFHSARAALSDTRVKKRDMLGILAGGSISFGVGYDFSALVFFCALFLVFFLLFARWRPLSSTLIVVVVGLSFGLPFALRQIHVIGVLGFDFWWIDFVLSAAIKVPFLSGLVFIPSQSELEAIYNSVGVLRAPASPQSSFSSILGTLWRMLNFVTLPNFGIITFFLFVIGVFVSAFIMLARLVEVSVYLRDPSFDPTDMSSDGRPASVSTEIKTLVPAAALFLALFLGIVAGLALFAPLSLHIYLKHQFPLLAAPLALGKAVLIGVCLGFALRTGSNPWKRTALFATTCFLVIDHASIQARALANADPIATGWVEAVRERPENRYVTSWIPDAPDAFTDNWSVGILRGREYEVVARIRSGEAPFAISDFFLFGQQDVAEQRRDYERPDFWLYFPIDQLTQFDRPQPRCRSEAIIGLINRISGRSRVLDIPPTAWIGVAGETITTLTPGSEVGIYGQLSAPSGEYIRSVEVREGVRTLDVIPYNCIYGHYAGVVRIPNAAPLSVFPIQIVATLSDSTERVINELTITIDPDAPPIEPSRLDPLRGRNQPSADELKALLPELPVVDEGHGWVILDLRPLYAKMDAGLGEGPTPPITD